MSNPLHHSRTKIKSKIEVRILAVTETEDYVKKALFCRLMPDSIKNEDGEYYFAPKTHFTNEALLLLYQRRARILLFSEHATKMHLHINIQNYAHKLCTLANCVSTQSRIHKEYYSNYRFIRCHHALVNLVPNFRFCRRKYPRALFIIYFCHLWSLCCYDCLHITLHNII